MVMKSLQYLSKLRASDGGVVHFTFIAGANRGQAGADPRAGRDPFVRRSPSSRRRSSSLMLGATSGWPQRSAHRHRSMVAVMPMMAMVMVTMMMVVVPVPVMAMNEARTGMVALLDPTPSVPDRPADIGDRLRLSVVGDGA
jgi:hypothetical protein